MARTFWLLVVLLTAGGTNLLAANRLARSPGRATRPHLPRKIRSMQVAGAIAIVLAAAGLLVFFIRLPGAG